MKKSLLVITLMMTFTALTAFTFLNPASNKYVGSSTCKACHNTDKTGKQYVKWESSDHAKAFKTLQSSAADKIASDKGFKTKAAETPECLSCHVTGMKEAGAQFDTKYAKEEGVTCESCHGAASGFKMKHQKKEKLPEAIAAGMKLPKVSDGTAKELCVTCHNDKCPTKKPFKFEEMWKKIAHPLPS